MQEPLSGERGGRPARLELEALDLEPGDLVLIDTAPLIYLIEGEGWRKETAAAFFAAAERDSLRLVASTLLWTELLTRPRARGDLELAARYRSFLADSRRVRLFPVEVAIAEEAAALMGGKLGRIRAELLGLADALHLATARVLGVRAMLSNDDELARLAMDLPQGPRVILIDELAFSLRSSPEEEPRRHAAGSGV